MSGVVNRRYAELLKFRCAEHGYDPGPKTTFMLARELLGGQPRLAG